LTKRPICDNVTCEVTVWRYFNGSIRSCESCSKRASTTAKIAKRHHRIIIMILDLLDNIQSISDCGGVRDFHELKGNRAGTYAMRVSRNYRITFRWDGQDVYDVDFENYH